MLKKILERYAGLVRNIPVKKSDNCLSSDSLDMYIHGKLSEKEKQLVEDHISVCRYCLRNTGNLLEDNNDNSFTPSERVMKNLEIAFEKFIDGIKSETVQFDISTLIEIKDTSAEILNRDANIFNLRFKYDGGFIDVRFEFFADEKTMILSIARNYSKDKWKVIYRTNSDEIIKDFTGKSINLLGLRWADAEMIIFTKKTELHYLFTFTHQPKN